MSYALHPTTPAFWLLVDTIPRDARNTGSINLGFEIVRDELNADVCHWSDQRPTPLPYRGIAFNVFYPTHLMNIVPFLRRHGIEPLRTRRGEDGPLIIAGGAGVGRNHILSEIANWTCTDELDYSANAKEITSRPVIKGRKAVIELTRGCRHRCAFCEYGCAGHGYREKPLDLVIEQTDKLWNLGIRRINYLSANFAGYSQLDALMEHAALRRGVTVLNTDVALMDVPRILPWLTQLPRYLKLGVESFDEDCRFAVGKRITDMRMMEYIEALLETCSGLHFYLIYSLPGDCYSSWFSWVGELGRLRRQHTREFRNLFGEREVRNTKNIRFEFSLTNFEPAEGTPLAFAPPVDFEAKELFLQQWFRALGSAGFIPEDKVEGMDYRNARGRMGRKELSYRMLLALKSGGSELTEELIEVFPNGLGRSVSDAEAERFLTFRGEEAR